MQITHTGIGMRHNSKTITFDGQAGTGLHTGGGAVPVFTVTGEVLVAVLVPYCTVDVVTTTGTLALGVTGSTALFIAATDATTIDAGEFWLDTSPDANGLAVPAALKDIAITDNLIMTAATAAITGGSIRLDIYWLPLSANGLVA